MDSVILPTDPLVSGGVLSFGRTTAELATDPMAAGPRPGRARRWCYGAAGDPDTSVGCAVVDLGPVGTAFAWVRAGDRVVTWERRSYLGRGLWVGRTPSEGAGFSRGNDHVVVAGDGSIELDVGTRGERLRAEVRAGPSVRPVALSTRTPAGGWNATVKAAGYPAEGEVETADGMRRLVGGGWRDWTAGRQDRRTSWRWAAAAGVTLDDRRVGLNVSTGMNAAGTGEDIVWWEGVPVPLHVTRLEPVGAPGGAWVVEGPDWRLDFVPDGVRAADENLLIVRSRYVQPVGSFHGRLPDPAGVATEVRSMPGVTEEHEAVW